MTLNHQSSEFSALPHVLVVDDDNRIRNLITRFLREHDFITLSAPDAFRANEILQTYEADAVIIDVMMPGKDGFTFLRELREKSEIPVIMLTALGESDDRIKGLECGADDYLAKPFEPKELILRLKAILKRSNIIKSSLGNVYKIGELIYDKNNDEIRRGSELIKLTSVEINLLRVLMENNGEVMSRESLASACGLDAGERTIDVQVTRLRRKIEENTKVPRYLLTLRGKGYMLRAVRAD